MCEAAVALPEGAALIEAAEDTLRDAAGDVLRDAGADALTVCEGLGAMDEEEDRDAVCDEVPEPVSVT